MKTQAIVFSVLLGLISAPVLAAPPTLADLEARIVELEAKLAAVKVGIVNGQPTVRFTGVNVQIVNGTKSTESSNGLGNLILGYDLARNDGRYFCSEGAYPTSGACSSAGGLWAVSHKSGSHYLVTGDSNNYSRFGGVVVGSLNTSNGPYASVSGGWGNTASGYGASVSGGVYNTASGTSSSVSAGIYNRASGVYSSVSGGDGNTASGSNASVSGGGQNTASDTYSSVSGGWYNTASGNTASVSGGASRTATGPFDWVAGGLFQDY